MYKRQRQEFNTQRTEDYRTDTYPRTVMNPEPTGDAPQIIKDYYDDYKAERGYYPRCMNSGLGWNKTSNLAFINAPILGYADEIRSAVLLIHGEKAHSRYCLLYTSPLLIQGYLTRYHQIKSSEGRYRDYTLSSVSYTHLGTQYAFISNKICQMFVVPRSNLSYLNTQEKLQKPEFYILLGEDESTKPQAYICLLYTSGRNS